MFSKFIQSIRPHVTWVNKFYFTASFLCAVSFMVGLHGGDFRLVLALAFIMSMIAYACDLNTCDIMRCEGVILTAFPSALLAAVVATVLGFSKAVVDTVAIAAVYMPFLLLLAAAAVVESYRGFRKLLQSPA